MARTRAVEIAKRVSLHYHEPTNQRHYGHSTYVSTNNIILTHYSNNIIIDKRNYARVFSGV